MKYKLLAIDLDGTLTNQRKEVTPHTLETLLKAQQQGLRIVLATGRPTHGVTAIAECLQLDKYGGFILSYNGGEITCCKTQEVLYQQALDTNLLPIFYRYAKEHHFAIETFHGPCAFTETPNDKYIQQQAKTNHLKVVKVSNFLNSIKFPVIKCLIVGEANRLMILEEKIKTELKDKANIFRSEPFFLELVNKGIDKAHSLSILLSYLGLTSEQLIAIGDSYNDVSMIQFAGLGVAMANAPETVREKAYYVTLSNEEEGVAFFVEKVLK